MSQEESNGYILFVQGPYGSEKIEVSPAQVQFWPEIVGDWRDNGNCSYLRIDLMTDEWRSKVVRRLDQ